MHFFTADQHYGHKRIIEPDYCDRPFESIEEMDEALIANHNAVVKPGDIVFHVGDFALVPRARVQGYIDQLNGNHVFIRGSHDRWLQKSAPYIVELKIEGQQLVLCHYAMRTWRWSHYNSWQLYGHSHGKLEPIGKQWDIGVDNNYFYPVSFDQIVEIMAERPDNPNLIRRDKS